jgi:hypothetical protein
MRWVTAGHADQPGTSIFGHPFVFKFDNPTGSM